MCSFCFQFYFGGFMRFFSFFFVVVLFSFGIVSAQEQNFDRKQNVDTVYVSGFQDLQGRLEKTIDDLIVRVRSHDRITERDQETLIYYLQQLRDRYPLFRKQYFQGGASFFILIRSLQESDFDHRHKPTQYLSKDLHEVYRFWLKNLEKYSSQDEFLNMKSFVSQASKRLRFLKNN